MTQAGTTQVPFFAALGGFEDLSDRVGDIGGDDAYAPGVWQTTQVTGRDGDYAVPWFTEARSIYYRKDLLEKAGVDPATAFTDWDAFQATLQSDQGLGRGRQQGHVRVRLAGQAGVRPRPPRDAVRVGRRRRRAQRGRKRSRRSTRPEAPEGVEFVADLDPRGPLRPDRPGERRHQVETRSRAADSPSGSVARGCSPRSRARTTTWVDGGPQNVGIAPMPSGPDGKAYTFVGGSNLMMFKPAQEQGRRLGADEVPVPGRHPDGVRRPDGHVPRAPRAAAGQAGRQGRQLRGLLPGDPGGPHVRADPAVGAGRDRLQGRASATSSTRRPVTARATTAEGVQKELEKAARRPNGLLAQTAG